MWSILINFDQFHQFWLIFINYDQFWLIMIDLADYDQIWLNLNNHDWLWSIWSQMINFDWKHFNQEQMFLSLTSFDTSTRVQLCKLPHWKYHIKFVTRMLTFAHEEMYGIKKQSFQVLCTARFAPDECCYIVNCQNCYFQ